MSKTNINYVQGVSCIVIQNEKIVFETRAAGRDGAGMLDFCSGHIEPGETPEITMRRELHEELGIPPELSANIQKLGEHRMFLEKRQKEQYWEMTFYCLIIPPDFKLTPQNSEVATIKKVPFNDGINLVKNGANQFPYDQIIPTIQKLKQIYRSHHK